MYPRIPSDIRPVPHGRELNAPVPPATLENMADDVECKRAAISEDDSDNDYNPEDNFNPQRFSQSEFNDLVRDLNCLQKSAELLGSLLKSKNLLVLSWYRHREKELLPLFSQKKSLVFCNNINELMYFYDIEHDPIE